MLMGESEAVDTTVVDAAAAMRRLLAAINAGELECPPASRHRLEGAAVTLEALAGRPQTSDSGQACERPERDLGSARSPKTAVSRNS